MTVPEPQLGRRWQLTIAILFIGGSIVAAPSIYGLFVFIPFGAVGALLAIRRPGTSIGWILIALAWCFALMSASVDATAQEFGDGTVGLPTALFAVIQSAAGSIALVFFGLLALVYPSGRLPQGWWGRVSRLTLGICVVFVAASFVMPVISVALVGAFLNATVKNPFALWPDQAIWTLLADSQLVTPNTVIVPALLLVAVGAISLIVHSWRADGVERQQVRWLGASIALVVVAAVVGFILGLLVPEAADTGLAWIPVLLAFPLVPVAVGVAILRYRMYEIDRVVSRTVAWGLVSGVLLVVFGGVVISLEAALADVTQGQTLAVAASTLIAFGLFQPVRRRVQSIVDRRFDRARYDGEHTVAAFAERLRDQVDLEALEMDMILTVGGALRPTSARLWLKVTSRIIHIHAAP